MVDKTPTYTQPVLDLMAMTDEVVPAKCLAPILKMHPSVIINYAKSGEWDHERLGNYIVSGTHVKFYRIDFLRKGGWIQ